MTCLSWPNRLIMIIKNASLWDKIRCLETKNKENFCRVCGSDKLVFRKKSNIQGNISSQNFAITNFDYGVTGELWQCKECGFLQCTDLENVLSYYENLQDPEYEATRSERLLQEKKLLSLIQKIQPKGRLLDIGAASGVLVQVALELGYDAEGIEPSRWLRKQAFDRKLPIHLGTLPHKEIQGSYDVITVIDVIEHVPNPKEFLQEITDVLTDDGIVIIVTPDLDSLAVKLLRWRWWHFRIAHIGYFNKRNLNLLAQKTGLKCIQMEHPTWYFSAKYLMVRVLTFFPKFLQFSTFGFLKRIVIPINLRDSILGVYRRSYET